MMKLSIKGYFVWLCAGMCLWTMACAWFQPESEPEMPVPVSPWGDLALEVLPQHLPTPLPETLPKPPEKRFFIHTVSWQGETLMAIARWYTGEGRKWVVIADANPNLEPKRMHVGDRIKIPADLLITRKPLPRVKPAAKRRLPKSPPPEPKAVDVELFGPIVSRPATQDTDQVTHPAPLETID